MKVALKRVLEESGRPGLPTADTEGFYTIQPITNPAELQRYGVTDFAAPSIRPRRRWIPDPLFLLTVVIPLMLGGIYNFVVASDRFVSTASFVVREAQRGGIFSLGASGGMTRSDDNSFAIAEYMMSRDTVNWLVRREGLRDIFASPDVDIFSRFPSPFNGDTGEDLYRHFKRYVNVDFNSSTGISTISMQGFSPAVAQRLTTSMLDGAETFVNTLNDRARQDAVAFARTVRDQAKTRMATAQSRMTDFRNAQQVLNPDSEVSISNQLLTRMLAAISETDAQIAQIAAATPNNPRLVELRLKRDILSKNVEAQRVSMAGNSASLALKMEGYDRVRLERDLAEKSLVGAENALAISEQDAQKGHLYLERVVNPNLPDRYAYPRKYWNMFLLAGICLAIFWIVRKTTQVLRETRH